MSTPGPWLEVPDGTELVGPAPTIAVRGRVDYNTAEAVADVGDSVTPADRDTRGTERYQDPTEPGHGSYGIVRGDSTQPVPVEPDQLPGVTRPVDAIGYEWEGLGGVTAFEFQSSEAVGNDGTWSVSRTPSGFTDDLITPALTVYVRSATASASSFDLDPTPGFPGRFDGPAPPPSLLSWTDLDSLGLPARGAGEAATDNVSQVFAGPFRVAFTDGQYVAVGARLSWSDGVDVDERLRAQVDTSYYTTFDVMTDFPRYRWLYPDAPGAIRYGWGLILV